MAHTLLSQAELRTWLDYNPTTGIFTWLKSSKFKPQFVGTIAGSKYSSGYLVIKLNRIRYPAHVLVWLYMTGEFPKVYIDHINHNRLDNRFENLRDATNTDNQRNKSMQKNNTSGVTGVSWHSGTNRWHAQIYVDNKKLHLGSFASFSDAVDSRKNAEVLYGFHKNHGKDL